MWPRSTSLHRAWSYGAGGARGGPVCACSFQGACALRRLLVPTIQDKEDAWLARRRRCQTARLATAKSKAKAKRLAAARPARPQGRPRKELPPQAARPRGRRPCREEPPEEERRPRGRPRGEQAVPGGRPRREPVQEAQRPRGRPRLAPTLVQAAPSEPGPSYDPKADPVRWERSRF